MTYQAVTAMDNPQSSISVDPGLTQATDYSEAMQYAKLTGHPIEEYDLDYDSIDRAAFEELSDAPGRIS